MSFKLGISGQLLGGALSLSDICTDVLKKYDVDYIEIWPENIPSAGKEAHPDSYFYRDAFSAKDILDKYNIKVSAVSVSAAFIAEFSQNPEIYSVQLCEAVETAAGLKAEFVNHYCFNLSLNALDREYIKKSMSPALELAKKRGITLILENEAHDMTKTPEMMLDILNIFNDDSFLTTFDPTNYYQAGIEGYPYAYDTLKDKIGYVHIKNGRIYAGTPYSDKNLLGGEMMGIFSGKKIEYCTADSGAVNIGGLLRRLKQDNYCGYIILEPHVPQKYADIFYEKEVDYINSFRG